MKTEVHIDNDNELEFAPEDDSITSPNESDNLWKILIIDDEPDIHEVTKMALSDFDFEGRQLHFLDAYSSDEAIKILNQEKNVAIALVDIVMESEHAGLTLVKHIRDVMKNNLIRLIIRTGQPGQAPEKNIIKEYDINDYKEKTELTSQKLYSSILSSLRSYKDIISLNDYKQKLENIIDKQSIELRDEKTFISTVFDITGALVIMYDTEGKIVRHNQACEDITQFSFSENLHIPIWDWLIPEKQRSTYKQLFNKALTTEKNTQFEGEWLRKDNQTLYISWSNAVIKNEFGKTQYIVSTGIDISDRHASEISLIEAKNQAVLANEAKSFFLSKMSHELRTPLNAILGFSQMLELDENEFTETQFDNVKEILKAGYYLLELINDILNLAKIESGSLDVNITNVNLHILIDDCLTLMLKQMKEKHITLVNKITNEKIFVDADLLRLKQVLLNILTNAVKYNKENGSIEISCNVRSNETIKISVTDTGHGLTEDQITKLFTPFERLTTEHEIEGTGIGLVITKSLVELMGGTIGINSEINHGTTVWFVLALSKKQ